MIPPQELRIGNYVLWQGKIVEVISIMPRWACVRYDEVTFSRSYEEFQSVPITEEWLREFGFEENTRISHSSGKGVEYATFHKFGLLWNSSQAKWWWDNRVFNHPPMYVHQLQNLTYALTGEELKRKEFEE